jgi:tRNA pseudouridine55 synthase
MGVGRGTRLLRFLGDLSKTYLATIRLGIETTTLDADGDVVREQPVNVTVDRVEQEAASLTGELLQTPPAYSAVKVGGRKLYEAARIGQRLEAPPRRIRVDSFDVLDVDGALVRSRIVCSGGTYVRVLASDLGAALGCGAHLEALRRTDIGPFSVRDAGPPEDPGPVLELARAVSHLPRVPLEAEEAVAVSHGRPLGPSGISGPYGVFAGSGELLAVYEDDGPRARPLVVLAAAGPTDG